MNARLISAPSLSPEEQKNRLAEFFANTGERNK